METYNPKIESCFSVLQNVLIHCNLKCFGQSIHGFPFKSYQIIDSFHFSIKYSVIGREMDTPDKSFVIQYIFHVYTSFKLNHPFTVPQQISWFDTAWIYSPDAVFHISFSGLQILIIQKLGLQITATRITIFSFNEWHIQKDRGHWNLTNKYNYFLIFLRIYAARQGELLYHCVIIL